MTLNYLDFEYSEDTEGVGTFDAMASVMPAQLPAVHAELELVLAWAVTAFGVAHGPADEGFAWDHDLQSQQEYTVNEHLAFDPGTGRVSVQPGHPGAPRHTVTLSLSGDAAFCDAFRLRFELD